jgi:hypothetical protein
MRSLFSFLFFFTPVLSFSQRVIDVNKQDVRGANSNIFFVVAGEPFVNAKFTRLVDGSPYFNDEWMKGFAMLDSTNRYSGMVKLDLMENKVHFQDEKGNEMVATSKIRQLILVDTMKQVSFTFVHSSSITTADPKNGWYQLLAEIPSAKLYRQSVKSLQEIKPYNSATVEQYIRTADYYYVLYNGKLTSIKKIKDLADILVNKKQEILKYISDNKLNGRSENDFINVMVFYKSLQQ